MDDTDGRVNECIVRTNGVEPSMDMVVVVVIFTTTVVRKWGQPLATGLFGFHLPAYKFSEPRALQMPNHPTC
ncbi:hypothetical protein VPH35_060410 [Triticum aestivum]